MTYEKIDEDNLKQTIDTVIKKEDLIKDKEELEMQIINLQNRIKDIDNILKVFESK